MGDLLGGHVYLLLLLLLLCDELGLKEVIKEGAVKEATIGLHYLMMIVRAGRRQGPG